VAQLASAIGKEMGLPERQVEGLRVIGYLHDIGKIAVPAEILSKPTKLSEIELAMVQAHAQSGYDILKNLEFPWAVAQAALQHHERLDGSGYPQGLKGPDIILEARILMVADVVEAMASHRPYRASRGLEAALDEISANKGRHYDEQAVDVCVRLFTEKGFKFNGDSGAS
jgi:putative nucleotidyltransferase with HDIG domain